jgi:DNA mismatch repair protein MutL
MTKKVQLNRLPQELVNKIAAGEVVERPSSVVKELVDNSIDANATKIQIKIVNGGIDLIEVSDNGVGIPKENLEGIFDSHTTSKISSFEDLNNLLTMGFRGEALSTINSVSKVRVLSKYVEEDIGNEISFKQTGEKVIKSSARESGTVVCVENIFGDVPARRKFLKSAQTEYKKILEILTPYFLIYPNIHFVLVKDSKKVFDLKDIPSSKQGSTEKARVEEVLKGEFVERMLKVFFNGAGVSIKGFVGHPSDHQKTATNQYLFINRRPIRDNGVSRAVYQGFERYIPHGEKVPYILLLDINPELVDVNVHPRKEEVRFLNPFRIYSAVQEAVSKAVHGATSYRVENREFSSPVYTPSQPKKYESRDITFVNKGGTSVQDSLLFSKEALEDDGYIKKEQTFEQAPIEESRDLSIRDMFQIFNKYIVIEFNEEVLWVIDQHAAAERITFEKLSNALESNIEKQKFLVPFEIHLSDVEILGMEELREFFKKLGFEYEISGKKILITSCPVEFVNADFRSLFQEIFALTDDVGNISNEVERLKKDMYATMACHSSVRSGQKLKREEMLDIYKKLMDCENPYSCPHGRPAVWRMRLSDIDMNFERTY